MAASSTLPLQRESRLSQENTAETSINVSSIVSTNNDGNDNDNVIIPVYWCQVHVDYKWNRKYLLASCFSRLVVKSELGFGASMKPAPFIIVMGSRCGSVPRRRVMKAVNGSHAHMLCPGGVHFQLPLCEPVFPPINSDDVKRLKCVPCGGLHTVGAVHRYFIYIPRWWQGTSREAVWEPRDVCCCQGDAGWGGHF